MSARTVIHAEIATFADLQETISLFIPIASPYDRECLAAYLVGAASRLAPPSGAPAPAEQTQESEKETML